MKKQNLPTEADGSAYKNKRNIIFLGLVSMFADLSTEMVYPMIPLYLTAVFGATPALVGTIEGIAESAAALLKVAGGRIADRTHRKKPLAFAGYATGLLYKLALLIAGSWAGILAARVLDRIGKGIRTAPRDVLVAENAEKKKMGRSFGIHKMLDMAGSAAGIFLAWLLMRGGAADGGYDFKRLFLLSMIPAVLSLCAMLCVREKRERVAAVRQKRNIISDLRSMPRDLVLFIAVTFLFTLGNSSNAFLLLRVSDAGFTAGNVVLLYLAYNLTASVLAIPMGSLSDRLGRKKLLCAGYVIFSCVYAGFAFADKAWMFIVIFIVYGIYAAVTSGAERAFISEITPSEMRGTMLGLHSTVTGIALLPASVIAGWLWDVAGARAPFIFGASLSLAAALLLGLFMQGKNART